MGPGDCGLAGKIVKNCQLHEIFHILWYKVRESTRWALLGEADGGAGRLRACRNFPTAEDLLAEDDEVFDQDVHLNVKIFPMVKQIWKKVMFSKV